VKSIKILERLLIAVPIMLAVAVLVFLFMRMTPGDPIDLMMGSGGNVSEAEVTALTKEFNLDKPLHVQLGIFLKDIATGDFGESFTQREPVTGIIKKALPATVELAFGAAFFALIFAIPIGVYSAVKQNSVMDRASMAFSFLGISMPAFWFAIILIIVFGVKLQWLPITGRLDYGVQLEHITGFYLVDSIVTGNWAAFKNAASHLILPSVALGMQLLSILARVSRSSMLEVLRQDYVMLARAKGLREFTVIVKHAMRNALIPTVTVLGIQVGVLLGGNMIVETVFGWPGLGRLAVDAIFNRDFPLIQAVVMFYALTFIVANLVVDVLYTYINPKISL